MEKFEEEIRQAVAFYFKKAWCANTKEDLIARKSHKDMARDLLAKYNDVTNAFDKISTVDKNGILTFNGEIDVAKFSYTSANDTKTLEVRAFDEEDKIYTYEKLVIEDKDKLNFCTQKSESQMLGQKVLSKDNIAEAILSINGDNYELNCRCNKPHNGPDENDYLDYAEELNKFAQEELKSQIRTAEAQKMIKEQKAKKGIGNFFGIGKKRNPITKEII